MKPQELIARCSEQILNKPIVNFDRQSAYEIYCPVCGNESVTFPFGSYLREDLFCSLCGSWNRQRQMAAIVCYLYGLSSLADGLNLTIFNTESNRAVHKQLTKNPNYFCSEYKPAKYPEARNLSIQDIEELGLRSDSIDLFLSSDVLEHVPNPWTAMAEIYRVLKPGGYHVFTAPFNPEPWFTTRRAYYGKNSMLCYEQEPIFHGDPVHSDGCIVFHIFSWDFFVWIARTAEVNVYHLNISELGIVGPDNWIFTVRKRFS